jgi:hypothetical protein
MPISVKLDQGPDEVMHKLMVKAIDEGLQLQIGKLFGLLCTRYASEDHMIALEGFSTGVANARKAYHDAKVVVEREGPL